VTWAPQRLALRQGEAAFHVMWEDTDLNADLLAPRPGERVLCIASAGENALAYAACGADVLALDVNPAQVHLARLKRQTLLRSPGDYAPLFGDGRYPAFAALLPRLDLPPGTLEHWRERADSFEESFHLHGAAGRPLRWVRAFVRSRGGLPALERLLECRDVAESHALWREELAPRLLAPDLARAVAQRPFLRLFGVPAEQAAALRDYDRVLARRLDEVFSHTLLRDNPWMQLATLHRYATPPAHLRPRRLDAMRRGARRLRVEVGDVAAHLAGRPETYDAVDLLDAPDWLQGDALERLFRRAARGLAPGGRLLLRSVGSHTLAAAARAGLALQEETTEAASRLERTGLYRVTALLAKAP